MKPKKPKHPEIKNWKYGAMIPGFQRPPEKTNPNPNEPVKKGLSYQACAVFSYGMMQKSHEETIRTLINQQGGIQYIRVRKAKGKAERAHGTDYIPELTNGTTLTVDIRARGPLMEEEEYKHGEGPPDDPPLVIETDSVLEDETHDREPGWIYDLTRQQDYIYYCFSERDYPDAFLIPLPMLRQVWDKYGELWTRQYGKRIQWTEGSGKKSSYNSAAVHVPSKVVIAAIVSLSTTKSANHKKVLREKTRNR